MGRLLLTKAPGVYDSRGDRDAEDVTDQYKHRERTSAERASVARAMRLLAMYVIDAIYIISFKMIEKDFFAFNETIGFKYFDTLLYSEGLILLQKNLKTNLQKMFT